MEFGSLIPYAGILSGYHYRLPADRVGGWAFCLERYLFGTGQWRLHTQTKTTAGDAAVDRAGQWSFYCRNNNPATIGNENVFHKFLSSLFQSVTTRTAGYAQMDQASDRCFKALSVALMFIGGSPGSTAGGVKTVTMAVLLMTALQALRGNYQTTVNGKSISL